MSCRCSLLSKTPCSFTHEGAPCGWPDLLPVCPDCGKQGKECTFFNEEFSENGCSGLTRVVLLCLRCQIEGAKRRDDGPIRARIALLSGGAACDAAQLKSFKEALRFESKLLWLPDVLESPDTAFFWDRTRVPWRFRVAAEGAEQVTMRSLYERLGIVAAGPAAHVEQVIAPIANVADGLGGFSDAQLAQMTRLVTSVVSIMLAQRSSPCESGAAASGAPLTAVAQEAGRLAATVADGTRAPGGQNPSAIFNLGPNFGNVGNGGSLGPFPSGPDSADLAAIVRALREGGCSPEEIARALQSALQPAHKPTPHMFE
jgi:hypothetical protein